MGVDDDAELRRVLTENVADTIAFLRELGLNFLGPLPQPPHSAPRLHQVMPTSPAYIFQLGATLPAGLASTCAFAAPATKLLMQDGGVVGVEAQTRDGPIRVRTRAGVVLASGDIGGDTIMMHAHMKNWVDGIEIYNPNNTGDGHKLAAAIGARIVSRKDLRCRARRAPALRAAEADVAAAHSGLSAAHPRRWSGRMKALPRR